MNRDFLEVRRRAPNQIYSFAVLRDACYDASLLVSCCICVSCCVLLLCDLLLLCSAVLARFLFSSPAACFALLLRALLSCCVF